MARAARTHVVDRAVTSLRNRIGADRVATAGDRYDQAVTLWNAEIRRQPAVVVRCLSATDVQAAIRTAREHDLPLSVRATGHDWVGRTIRDDGMVIDVSGMRAVTIDAAGVATIGGGVTGNDILTAGEPFGLAAVTATSGAVGVLGFALGGGYGLLCGRSGLGADNLLSAEVVLADGTLVTADDERNPDLLWALRGGGGNFGVVISARVRMHPVSTPLAGQVLYPWSQAAAVLGLLGDFLLEAPDELTVLSALITAPTGDRGLLLLPLWSGDPGAPHPSLEAVATLGTPMMAQIAPTSPVAMAAEFERQNPAGARLSVRTRTVPGLTPEVVDALYRGAETFTSQRSVIALHHFHGAAARVPVEDTAVALRTPHLMAELVAQWEQGDPDVDRHRSWVQALSEDLGPLALPGGYANLLTPEAVDQVAHLYGPNTSRLLEIKARVDPDHVFVATPLPEPAQVAVPG